MKTETWVDPRPINWLALDFQQSIIFCSETKLVELVELQTTANQKSQTCRSFHHLRDKVPPQLADPKFQRVAAPEVHKSQRWTYLNDEMPRKNLTLSVSGCIRMASMIFRWQAQKSPKIRADFRSDKKTSHLHSLLPPNQHTGSTSKRNNRQLTVASKWLFKDLIWSSLSWGGSYFRRLCLNRRSIPWRDMAYK